MKTSSKALLALLTAMGAAAPALAANGFGNVGAISYEQVRFYNPTSSTWPTQAGTLATDYCAGADRCGEPMTFTSTYAGKITVTAATSTGYNGIVAQDLSQNYGGLGVMSLGSKYGAPVAFGDDEIDAGETLTLTFLKKVTIVGLHFFDGNNTGTEWGDKGTLRIDGGPTFDIGLSSYVTSDSTRWLTGTSFTFGHKNNDYFLGAVKLMQPVPEPETYAMMLAGLAALGLFARRRRAA